MQLTKGAISRIRKIVNLFAQFKFIFYYPRLADYTDTKHNTPTLNPPNERRIKLADNGASVIIGPLLRYSLWLFSM
jgi:hypothetical protein